MNPKLKRYVLQPHSLRKKIYDVTHKAGEKGLTTKEICERIEKQTNEYSEASICQNMLAMSRDGVFLLRLQKPNPTTKRPVYYYVAVDEPKIPATAG
jgi:hypothetical protein